MCTVGKGRVGSDLVKPFEYVRAKRTCRLVCRQISVGDIGIKAVFLVKTVSDLYEVSPHILCAFCVPVKKRNAVAQIFPHLVDVQGSRCALCPHIELSAVLSVCRAEGAEHIFKFGHILKARCQTVTSHCRLVFLCALVGNIHIRACNHRFCNIVRELYKLGIVRRPLNFDVVHKLIKPGKLVSECGKIYFARIFADNALGNAVYVGLHKTVFALAAHSL